MGILSGSAREFFRALLDEWLGRRHVRVSSEAHTYVTDVLARPGTDPKATAHLLKKPLGRLYLEASVAEARYRVALLRQVGDNALLLSGWWREHLLASRSGVDADYYTRLGRMAYGSISQQLFDELAQKFEALTDVLMRMELACTPQATVQAVRLYGLWLRTREAAIAEALIARGFVLTDTDKPQDN